MDLYIIKQSNRLEERSRSKNFRTCISDYLTVVYKSNTQLMGFQVDEFGVNFLRNYLNESILWDSHNKKFIDFNKCKNDESRYLNIEGLTFFDCNESFQKKKETAQEVLMKEKKNLFFKKIGKSTVSIPFSPIVNFKDDNVLNLDSLLDLKQDLKNFIIWDWGEFGLYFHVILQNFNLEVDKIKNVTDKLKLNLYIKTKEIDVPTW